MTNAMMSFLIGNSKLCNFIKINENSRYFFLSFLFKSHVTENTKWEGNELDIGFR